MYSAIGKRGERSTICQKPPTISKRSKWVRKFVLLSRTYSAPIKPAKAAGRNPKRTMIDDVRCQGGRNGHVELRPWPPTGHPDVTVTDGDRCSPRDACTI